MGYWKMQKELGQSVLKLTSYSNLVWGHHLQKRKFIEVCAGTNQCIHCTAACSVFLGLKQYISDFWSTVVH